MQTARHRTRPDAPRARRATPHPPPLAPPFLARRSSRARRAPPPVRTCTRARTAQKIRPSPRRSFETACFRFFAKHFKLCGQLAEQGREGREGTAVPAAGGYNFPKLGKHFKLFRQFTELK